jgi:hypothetical protein
VSVFPSPTATFSPTPILSPTPSPAGCVVDGIINGSFEESIHDSFGWILGNDPVPPQLAADDYLGLRVLRLGNPPDASSKNVVTYSSVRQLITLPPSAITAKLFWAHESFTQETPDANIGIRNDRQELILLSPELVTLDILYRRLINDPSWREEVTDLTPHIGKTFYIYFNVFNDSDGLRTWMNLDAIRLEVCYSVPTPTVTLTPFPTVTFTPTPGFTVEAIVPSADGITTTDRAAVGAEITEDPLQVVIPESEDGRGGDTAPGLLQGVGNFLSENWTWAIPWGLLLILLLWRFIR